MHAPVIISPGLLNWGFYKPSTLHPTCTVLCGDLQELLIFSSPGISHAGKREIYHTHCVRPAFAISMVTT